MPVPSLRGGAPQLSAVVADDGVRWLDARKSLTPRYLAVWRDLALCHLMLAAGIAAVVVAARPSGRAAPAVVLAGALWLGYWLHALFLFGHEGAHFNLARTARANDAVGNAVVWPLFGSTSRHYRGVHMPHHLHLGDHGDTEVSYYRCLSVANMVKAFTGVHVVEVLLLRARADREGPAGGRSEVWASLRSVALHGGLLACFLAAGWYAAAAAWVVGVGGVFPFCAAVRTIVEHRRVDATCDVDFTVVEHGAVNRLFGDGVFARTFGAAGFNRHLLHHWDPTVSYTRLRDMERFFARTQLAAEMERSRTTYRAALRVLRAGAHGG